MTNYLKIHTFYINNSSITHPRATSSLSASRLPWCAAQSVGVIPSSSGAFRSLRVASFSRCRWPSRAARWYLSFMAAAEPSIPAHGWSFGGCCVGEVSRALQRVSTRATAGKASSSGCYGEASWGRPRPLPLSAHLRDENSHLRWHIHVKPHSVKWILE